MGHASPHATNGCTGDMDRDELVASLSELLEAERAGVRLGAELLRMAEGSGLQTVAQTIREDEARWCAMLVGALGRLGASPSTKVGGFYAKVMAVEGLEPRLAFLNRGQAWVVRRLEALLPKIRDEQLRAELRAMLEAHVANIELTASALERTSTS
jgi:hypothetical protein